MKITVSIIGDGLSYEKELTDGDTNAANEVSGMVSTILQRCLGIKKTRTPRNKKERSS